MTYSSPWAGGIVPAGDEVVIANGASITGPVINQGVLRLDRTAPLSIVQQISGTGSIVIGNTGTIALIGDNTYSGGTILAGGVLSLAGTSALGPAGTIAFRGGTLRYTAVNTNDYSARFSNDADQQFRFDTNGLIVTATAPIRSTGGSLLKLGSGTLALPGPSGGTIDMDLATGVQAGSLDVGGSLPRLVHLKLGSSGTGSLQISRNANFSSAYRTTLGSSRGSYGSVAVEEGSFASNELFVASEGSGDFVLNGGGASANAIYVGTASGSGLGKLLVVGGTFFATNVLEASSARGTIEVRGGSLINDSSYNTRIRDGGQILLSGGTFRSKELAFSEGLLSISGGLFASTYSLRVGNAGGSPQIQSTARLLVTDGTLATAASGITGRYGLTATAEMSGGLWTNSGVLSVADSDAAATGLLTVTGGSIRTDALRLASTQNGNTGSRGSIRVSGSGSVLAVNAVVGLTGSGTLAVGGGGVVSIADTLSGGVDGRVIVDANGLLRIGRLMSPYVINNGHIVVSNSASLYCDTIFTGSGTLEKRGTGVLALRRESFRYGGTTIAEGIVRVEDPNALSVSDVEVQDGAALEVGVNAATIAQVFIPEGGLMRLSSTDATTVSAQGLFITRNGVSGGVDVGKGRISVERENDNGSVLVDELMRGQRRQWAAGGGVWSAPAAASSAAGGPYTIGWTRDGAGALAFGYAAFGDTNLDWTVDILDVANVIGSGKVNEGLPATWTEGDFNYDGVADILDIADFMSSGLFNAGSYNTPTVSVAVVPEPSVLGLAGVGVSVLGLMAARRRLAFFLRHAHALLP